MVADNDGYISANALAAITGKSRQWICELCKAGRIPARKEGSRWMIDPLVKLPPNGNAERKERRLKRIEEWRLARKAGLSIDEIERVPLPMEGRDALAIQKAIDAWVDQGADIDAQGNVTLNGESKGRILPWGAFERNWYQISKNSV